MFLGEIANQSNPMRQLLSHLRLKEYQRTDKNIIPTPVISKTYNVKLDNFFRLLMLVNLY